MKVCRAAVKAFFYLALAATIVLFGIIVFLDYSIGKDFKIKKGENLSLNSAIPITAEYKGAEFSAEALLSRESNEVEVELKMFGIIPFSKVNVQMVDELKVAVLGTPFGMRLYTEGVLVTELSSVETSEGTVYPAKEGGLRVGDYIISANGTEIHSNEDLSALVEASKGEDMKFLIKRGNKKRTHILKPRFSSETKSYKIGIWIRDSSAGIGTLTFYSPATDVVCGLGHGICDEDTGSVLSVQSGKIVSAEIIGIEKGKVGAPGQLKGRLGYRIYGNIDLNCDMGVFSVSEGGWEAPKLTEIALKQEVENGNAKILCTISGTEPKLYDCEITVKNSAINSKTQNLIVTLTDKELLEQTGGIVQGLSGSPIIQNGKLIGAVTHVLIDDPAKGYAIFAENMLETAQQVADEQALKDAS